MSVKYTTLQLEARKKFIERLEDILDLRKLTLDELTSIVPIGVKWEGILKHWNEYQVKGTSLNFSIRLSCGDYGPDYPSGFFFWRSSVHQDRIKLINIFGELPLQVQHKVLYNLDLFNGH